VARVRSVIGDDGRVRAVRVSAGLLATAILCLAAPAPAKVPVLAARKHPGIYAMNRAGEFHRLTAGYNSPVWSPGGGRIAVLRGNRIHLLTRAGRHLRDLGRAGEVVTSMVWSPDGRWIAYGLYRSIRNVAAEQLRTVGTSRGGHRLIARKVLGSDWTPSGRLGFVTIRGHRGRLATADATGDDRRRVLYDAIRLLDWSRDGRVALYERGRTPPKLESKKRELWAVDPAGDSPRRVASRVFSYGGYHEDTRGALSPDGRRALFTRASKHADFEDLWIGRTDGSGARRLIAGQFQPDYGWAPGGRGAYLLGASPGGSFDSDSHLYLFPRGRRRHDLGRLASGPFAWSPDGGVIAWVDNAARFGTIRADMTHRTVARFADDTEVHDMTWSPDGSVVLFEPDQQFPD
jgi:hypothetical protein